MKRSDNFKTFALLIVMLMIFNGCGSSENKTTSVVTAVYHHDKTQEDALTLKKGNVIIMNLPDPTNCLNFRLDEDTAVVKALQTGALVNRATLYDKNTQEQLASIEPNETSEPLQLKAATEHELCYELNDSQEANQSIFVFYM